MIFDYPTTPIMRRHGPRGYTSYESFKPWLRDDFAFRCAYCLKRERFEPDGEAAFSVDHFIPVAVDPTRLLAYDNLIYACLRCNRTKGPQIDLLDPCSEALAEHLRVQDDATVHGLTPQGRLFIKQLYLNHPRLIALRSEMMKLIRVLAASPDPVAAEMLQRRLGFPDDLPDLSALRPPGNSRPAGVEQCYFALRERGELPETY
jgi:hypothetical protein